MICDESHWLESGGNRHASDATNSTSKYSYHVKGDLQMSPSRRSRQPLKDRGKKSPESHQEAQGATIRVHLPLQVSPEPRPIRKIWERLSNYPRMTNRHIAMAPRSYCDRGITPRPIQNSTSSMPSRSPLGALLNLSNFCRRATSALVLTSCFNNVSTHH